MTGFGRADHQCGADSISVEVRSVNNRYINIKLKLPSRLLRHEAAMEEEVRRVVSRGSVDVFVRTRTPGQANNLVVNERLVKQYVASIQKLRKQAKLTGDLDLATVLSLPGVVSLEESDETDEQELRGLLTCLRKALKQLTEARQTEGARLKVELMRLLDQVDRLGLAILKQAAKVPGRNRKRLLQRIDKLLEGAQLKLDRTTLEREVALHADRADITEELARLKSHGDGFRALLARKSPVGRALDFVVQEMAREANTIGSKNQDVSIGRQVVELKSQVERLREQVQNLE